MPSPSEITRQAAIDFSQPFRFCGCKESALFAAALAMWPDRDLPWTIVESLPRIDPDDLKAAMTRALSRWAAVCGIQPRYTDTAREARLLVGSRAIDGPGRVLAECELPMPGVRQCRMWFDVGDDWALDLNQAGRRIVLELVGWHEAGHGLGLGHAPDGSANVMAPIYNPKQLTAGPWDVAQLQARYGKPAPVVPTPVPQPNPIPEPNPSGGIMGNLAALLKMLAQLQPIITWLANNQASMETIIAVLKKLAEAFAAKPVTAQPLSLSISKAQLRSVLGHVSGAFSVLAAQTPTPVDDAIAGVFAQAIGTDWLLDLLHMLVSGGTVTEAELAQAYTEVLAA